MKQDNMHLINKLFNNETIRTVWDKNDEKYYISVVDVIAVLTKSTRPRKYWSDLKKKIIEEGHNELSEKIGQLKLKSSDGKYYNTDVVDIEEMFRIIESIPSKNAEPVKQWLARLGKERIDEIFDPSIGIQRLVDTYRSKGYDDAWISKRIKGIIDRKQLTDVWRDGGITENKEYAILTNEIYRTWSGMTAKEYKEFKGLRKESLRDNMSDIEVLLTDLGELATRDIAISEHPQGLNENMEVAQRGGNVANDARRSYEQATKKKAISNQNSLNYQYIDESKQIENK